MSIDLDSFSYFWFIISDDFSITEASSYLFDLGYVNSSLEEVVSSLKPGLNKADSIKSQLEGKIIQYQCKKTNMKFRGTYHRYEDKSLILSWPSLTDIEEISKFNLARFMRHPCCQITDIVILKDVLKRTQQSARKLEVDNYEIQLEEQKHIIRHQNKLASIGELAAGVGHEINNPLMISMGYTEIIKKLLLKEDIKNPKIFENLEKQIIAHERIQNIVNGLRVFSRNDTENAIPFSLKSAIDQTFGLVSEIFAKEGCAIINETPNAEFYIFGVVGEIQQVIMNLITNAKHAVEGQKKKEIRVSLSEASRDKVVITVSDNGRGIPEEIREKIFNPFFTTKEVGKGTGLGLALVQKIIEKMNGEIQVESKLGSGTTFKISIPSVMNHQSLLGIDEFK